MGDGTGSSAAAWLVATRSAGKVAELVPLLEAHGWQVQTLEEAGVPVSPLEEVLETAETFEANALAKARYFARQTGRIVLADDSGLAVEALQGRPGVHSKRWSQRPDLEGPALDAVNNALLLSSMATVGTDPAARRARYVCAAACVHGAREWVVRGETAGHILAAPRGTGGFGYDPLFWSEDLQAGFAEVTREAKARVSHRGRAFSALLSVVAEALGADGAR